MSADFGILGHAGINGRHWSRVSHSDQHARYLYFFNSNVYPSDSNNRYLAFPARCHTSVIRSSVLTPNKMWRYASKKLRKCLGDGWNVADCVGGNTIVKLSISSLSPPKTKAHGYSRRLYSCKVRAVNLRNYKVLVFCFLWHFYGNLCSIPEEKSELFFTRNSYRFHHSIPETHIKIR